MSRLLSPEQILEQLKIRDPEIIPPWVRDQWKAIAAAQDAQTAKAIVDWITAHHANVTVELVDWLAQK
jgi:hypothetical protein